MGSCEQAVTGLKSQAVSAQVNKHLVTIFSKNMLIIIFNLS